MKTKTIRVAQRDIDRGIRGSSDSCPIALAANLAFADVARLTVGEGEIAIAYSNENWRYLGLPGMAREFIERFDQRESVEPFAFRVKLS